MTGLLHEGIFHVQGLIKPANFEGSPWAYVMCNWAQILICWRHWSTEYRKWPFLVLGQIYGHSDLGHKFGHKFSISSHIMIQEVVDMIKVWHVVDMSRVTWHTWGWSRWTQRPQEPLVWHLIHVSRSNHSKVYVSWYVRILKIYGQIYGPNLSGHKSGPGT